MPNENKVESAAVVAVQEKVGAVVTPAAKVTKKLFDAKPPVALVCKPCGYVLAVVHYGAEAPELPETCPGKAQDAEGKPAVCGNATADHVVRYDATTIETDDTGHAVKGREIPLTHDEEIAAAEARLEELKAKKAAAEKTAAK